MTSNESTVIGPENLLGPLPQDDPLLALYDVPQDARALILACVADGPGRADAVMAMSHLDAQTRERMARVILHYELRGIKEHQAGLTRRLAKQESKCNSMLGGESIVECRPIINLKLRLAIYMLCAIAIPLVTSVLGALVIFAYIRGKG